MKPRAFLAGMAALIGTVIYLAGELILLAVPRLAASHRTTPAELVALNARGDAITAARRAGRTT